ncbi:MAG: signal peptidase I [Rhizobiaceae bacterium]
MSVANTDKSKTSGGIGEIISVVFQALLLAVFIRTFLFQPFSIPSGSMRPTLLVGDYLFVSKFSYGYSHHSFPFSQPNFFSGRVWSGAPERGDIAVFKYPPDPKVDYIKRVVGLPGDKVQMRGGVLFINDVAVERKRTGQLTDFDITGEEEAVTVFRETLPNGVSYDTLDILDRQELDNTREFLVPADHYFMVGDNRNNSADGRAFGFVPAENLVGKANLIFFSISDGHSPIEIWQWPSKARLSRILTWIE